MRRDSHYLVRLWQFNNVCDNFKKTEKSKVWIPTANVGTKQIKLTRKRPGNVQNFLINWSFSQTVKTKRLFPHYLLLENARKRKGNSILKWESEFTYFASNHWVYFHKSKIAKGKTGCFQFCFLKMFSFKAPNDAFL